MNNGLNSRAMAWPSALVVRLLQGCAAEILRLRTMLICTSSLLSMSTATAFSIDPFTRGGPAVDSEFANHVGSAVHEMQTEAALIEIGNPTTEQAPINCVTSRLGPATAAQARHVSMLVRGVRWPDDPNQLLPEFFPKWLAWMYDGHKIAKDGMNYQGKKPSSWADYFMNYRGHFGDMQQLHAMANKDGETANAVRERIISWIHFLYGVAICDVSPDTYVSKLAIADQFPRKQGWTVRYVLNPSKDKPAGSRRVPELATGALLHAVQDSFSAAHVQRAASATKQCPKGRVIRFNSYAKQSPLKHASADTQDAWLSGVSIPAKTPAVQASAHVLKLVRSRADWDTVVLPYLKNELFCLDADSEKSSSGGYK